MNNIFISYSHKDEEWKDRLVDHLKVLELEGYCTLWDDRKIKVGDDWFIEIEKALQESHIAVMLISVNFLISDFIREEEVSRILERRRQEGLWLIPVIVEPCPWKKVEWLASIQVLPKDGKPLSTRKRHTINTILANLAEDIAAALKLDDEEPYKKEPYDDEPGILDLRVQLDEAFELAMSSIRQIISFMADGENADRQWHSEAQKATAVKIKPKQAQKLVNSKADDFGKRARKLRRLRTNFDAASSDYFNKLEKMIQFQLSSGISTTDEMKNGVLKISEVDIVVRKAQEQYRRVLSAIYNLPEPTRALKIQKRNLISEIEKLNVVIGSWLDGTAALRSRFVDKNDSVTSEK